MFATVGLVLESLHGFKVRAYLDVSNDTRRLMWTLAHAHGTLLAVLNIVFGLWVRVVPDTSPERQRLVSRALLAASIIMPAGFFLGGVAFFDGDPGVGVLLLPIGALLLLLALFQAARAASGGEDSVIRPRASQARTKNQGPSTKDQ